MGRREKDIKIVGETLGELLPADRGRWWTVHHLLKLNLTLMIPLASAAAVGYDGTLMNGVQSISYWREYFGSPTGTRLGLINGIYPIGAVLSLPVTSYICDRFGRKKTIIFGLSWIIIGAILQCFAQNYAMMVVCRLVLGFASPVSQSTSPILIAELAYPTHRGKITTMTNSVFFMGSTVAAWVVFGCGHIRSDWSWRLPSLLQGLTPLIQLCLIWFVPESPRWLVAQGRADEAAAILKRLHIPPGSENTALVDQELQDIKDYLQRENELEGGSERAGWLQLIKTPGNRKRSLIAVIVGSGTQLNGVLLINYYLTLVLNTIGITSTKDQTVINGGLQTWKWLASIVGALAVDRLGRRTLYLTSTTGCLISYIIWTACSATFAKDNSNTPAANSVVAMIFIFSFFYAICWINLLIAYPCEVFPFKLRAKGMALTLTFNYVLNIISLFVNPIAMKAIAWKYYIVFCCFLGVLLILIYLFFPETKGHSLENIAEIFDGKNPVAAHEEDGKGMKGQGVEELEMVAGEKGATVKNEM